MKNGILLSDIYNNFAHLESNVEELKFSFNPSKLYLHTATELNTFNNLLRDINVKLKEVQKFVGQGY